MNRSIRLIVMLFIVVTALLTVSYINARSGHVPLMAIAHISMGLISVWAAMRLFAVKDKGDTVRDFAWFFTSFAIFVLFLVLPHIFLLSIFHDHSMFSSAMNWGYIIGHVFLFISLAIFIRIPLQWISPKLKNIGTAFFLVLGAFTTIVSIILQSAPTFEESTGLTFLNINPLVANIVVINVVLAWLPAAIYFIIKGIKASRKIVRMRALLIGIGIIVLMIGGPMHDLAKTSVMYFLADFLALGGVALLASGVLYKVESGQEINPEKKIEAIS